jgi:hypothetical protein
MCLLPTDLRHTSRRSTQDLGQGKRSHLPSLCPCPYGICNTPRTRSRLRRRHGLSIVLWKYSPCSLRLTCIRRCCRRRFAEDYRLGIRSHREDHLACRSIGQTLGKAVPFAQQSDQRIDRSIIRTVDMYGPDWTVRDRQQCRRATMHRIDLRRGSIEDSPAVDRVDDRQTTRIRWR